MSTYLSEKEDNRILVYSAATALFLEFVFLTSVAWHEHWLSHPQTTGLDPSKFLEAEMVEMPPPDQAKLRSSHPNAPKMSKEVTLSKDPNSGKKAKTQDTAKVPEENKTEQGAAEPNHGPIAVYAPSPVIPNYLRDKELKTNVLIEFFVTAQGSVTPKLLGSSGNEELDQIALETVRKWNFRPAEEGHKAIDSKVRLRIVFEVQ